VASTLAVTSCREIVPRTRQPRVVEAMIRIESKEL
jgi:hypothetical protein